MRKRNVALSVVCILLVPLVAFFVPLFNYPSVGPCTGANAPYCVLEYDSAIFRLTHGHYGGEYFRSDAFSDSGVGCLDIRTIDLWNYYILSWSPQEWRIMLSHSSANSTANECT